MSPPHDDPNGLPSAPRPDDSSAQSHSARYGSKQPAVDSAATNYSTPPAGDPHSTRHDETPSDPYATNYGPISPDTEGSVAGGLARRFGEYELLEEIGRGGMAIVYKARQQTPDRLVALKVIKSAELAGPDEVRNFRLEANEVARLDHAHIVPVYEVGEQDGQHFFTMKLFEGGSLNQHLARYRGDLKAAARLVATAARAVHHAHQRQLLHRDLKPGNILLDDGGQPHVADFGLAKRLGGEGEASQSVVAGTPEYMAPEQARNDPRLTTAVDVYGLGGILYALLTGHPPFRGQSLWETLRQVQSQEPTLPSAHRAGFPRDLETICLKCLAKEPGRRYGSAEALADDLERWLRGEPVLARPVGRWERVRMWRRRNPVVAALGAAFAAALIVGSILSTWFGIEAGRREKDTNDALEVVKDREHQLAGANAELEETLARSLLRPLGHQADKVTEPEIEAFWELARSSRRVRLLFVEQALRNPVTTRQMRNRADMAVHAAVGLDPAQRRVVEKHLLSSLEDTANDSRMRTDCALIVAAIGGRDAELAEAAARQCVEAMVGTTDHDTLDFLAEAVATLAGEMETRAAARQAATATSNILKAMAMTKDYRITNRHLGVVRALADCMDSEGAAAPCRTALEAMAQTAELLPRQDLSFAVSILAKRMNGAEAAPAAALALNTMDANANTAGPDLLSNYAFVVAVLAKRMERGEAARHAGTASRIIMKAMGEIILKANGYTPEYDPISSLRDSLWSLSSAMGDLAECMDGDERAARSRTILEAMNKAPDLPSLAALTRAIPMLKGRNETGAASRLVLEAMANTKDTYALYWLAQAIPPLTRHMSDEEAAAAGRTVLKLIAEARSPDTLRYLAEAEAALAIRMKAEPASAQTAEAGQYILQKMVKTDLIVELRDLAQAMEILTEWMSPKEAVLQATIAVEALLRAYPDNPERLQFLGRKGLTF
jgi:hypothetical protein